MKEKNKREEELDKRTKKESSMEIDEPLLADAETAELTREAQLESELSSAKDKYLRLYSEFENFRKRIAKERVDILKFANEEVMLAILPVIDDMERAVQSLGKKESNHAGTEGVQLVLQKLLAITSGKGLKPMISLHTEFNPDLHDAIANAQAEKEELKGKVIQEVEKGYYLNDKVIRHAKVIVGR